MLLDSAQRAAVDRIGTPGGRGNAKPLAKIASEFMLPRVTEPNGDFLDTERGFQQQVLGLLKAQAQSQSCGEQPNALPKAWRKES